MLTFSNPYIFATWWCKPLIFQIYGFFPTLCTVWNIKGLRYQVVKELENKSSVLLFVAIVEHYCYNVSINFNRYRVNHKRWDKLQNLFSLMSNMNIL